MYTLDEVLTGNSPWDPNILIKIYQEGVRLIRNNHDNPYAGTPTYGIGNPRQWIFDERRDRWFFDGGSEDYPPEDYLPILYRELADLLLQSSELPTWAVAQSELMQDNKLPMQLYLQEKMDQRPELGEIWNFIYDRKLSFRREREEPDLQSSGKRARYE